jgi:hypothetical protein
MGIQYYIQYDDTSEASEFQAEVYRWYENREVPGLFTYYDETIGVTTMDGWTEVIIKDDGIFIDGDFLVAFGSLNFDVKLGINNRYNGRAWDLTENGWNPWTDTYYIRAVVQSTATGEVAVIGDGPDNGENELDAFEGFIIYRDDEEIGRSNTLEYNDTLPDSGRYIYTISATYHEGETITCREIEVEWTFAPQDTDRVADESLDLPKEWAITSIYPNPFNPNVNVSVAVPEASKLTIEIFDLLGRSVAVVNQGQVTPGYHTFNWKAEGSSGVYFLNVSSDNGFNATRKIVYMK